MNIKRVLAAPYYIWNKSITKNEHTTQVAKFYLMGGEEKFLTNHPLDENSVVFDVGGFIGVFSDKIICRYNPYIYIFEPVSEYINILKDKYGNNPKVTLIEKGLGTKTETATIQKTGETSSLYTQKETEGNQTSSEKVEIADISEILTTYKIDKIDLFSVNIEGAEYDLLDAMIERGILQIIKTIQIQFHANVPNSQERRTKIINELSRTHKSIYSFPYVWEGFERIK